MSYPPQIDSVTCLVEYNGQMEVGEVVGETRGGLRVFIPGIGERIIPHHKAQRCQANIHRTRGPRAENPGIGRLASSQTNSRHAGRLVKYKEIDLPSKALVMTQLYHSKRKGAKARVTWNKKGRRVNGKFKKRGYYLGGMFIGNNYREASRRLGLTSAAVDRVITNAERTAPKLERSDLVQLSQVRGYIGDFQPTEAELGRMPGTELSGDVPSPRLALPPATGTSTRAEDFPAATPFSPSQAEREEVPRIIQFRRTKNQIQLTVPFSSAIGVLGVPSKDAAISRAKQAFQSRYAESTRQKHSEIKVEQNKDSFTVKFVKPRKKKKKGKRKKR